MSLAGPGRVVVAGAGFAGVKAARLLHAVDGAEVTLVDPTLRFTFRPLVHELVSEESTPNRITRPVHGMVDVATVRGSAHRVEGSRLLTREGPAVPFDHLVVAIGARPRWYGVPGAREHALPFWTLDHGLRMNLALKELVRAAEPDEALRVVVVGAGLTGVEVATEAAAFLERYDAPYDVTVVEMEPRLFPHMRDAFRRRVEELLERYHVRLLLSTAVQEVRGDAVLVRSGVDDPRTVASDLTVWCAGVQGRVLDPLTMEVDHHLRSLDRDDVLIVGDCARYPADLHVPYLAQTAEQAAEVAVHNLLHPHDPRAFEPQVKGTIVSVGPGQAVAELATGNVLAGRVPWHVKKQLYKWRLSR